jgi:L-methionine (R)-S-oxide reductase
MLKSGEDAALGIQDRLVQGSVAGNDDGQTRLVKDWLASLVERHNGISGTVYEPAGPDELALVVTHNVDDLESIRRIPRGEGIAGLAFERNALISTCAWNLGKERRTTPRYKFVDGAAIVAVPVHGAAGRVRAVVGITFRDDTVMDDAQLVAIDREAAALPG